MKSALNLHYQYDDHQNQYEVWTADGMGGIIGLGKTPEESVSDAITNCKKTILELNRKLCQLQRKTKS